MTPEYLLCDICNCVIDKDSRRFIATGTSMEGSGSSETTGEYVDLCGKCWGAVVVAFLKNKSYEQAVEMTRIITRLGGR
jgi:hypothetical protein